MEITESIRNSLQKGEWMVSIDFMYLYFHTPIIPESRKYLHFHIQGQSYQLKALRFGLSTDSMEITTIVKEVKQNAQNKGIRIRST